MVLYGRFFTSYLGAFSSLSCPGSLSCMKKKAKNLFCKRFYPDTNFCTLTESPIQKHCVNPALIVLMSSFRFYFTNLAYNALVREIDKDRTGANIKKMKTNMKNYYIINYITR